MKKLNVLIRENLIFFRLISNYIVIFVIALITVVIFYYSTLQTLKKYTIDSALSIMNSNISSIDSHFQEIDNKVERLAEDYNVRAFVNVEEPLEDADYESLRNLKDKLPYNYDDNSFIQYLYVFFPNSNVIVSPTFASARVEELMYDNYLAYEGMTFLEWKQAIMADASFNIYWPQKQIEILGEKMRVITYIRGIPNYDVTKKSGVVLALIDENDLIGMLDNGFIQNGGLSYIEDVNGNRIITVNHSDFSDFDFSEVVFDSENSVQIGTEYGPMLVVRAVSEQNGWNYISAIPINTIMEKTNHTTRTFVLIISGTFLLILLIAAILAYRNSRPIQDLVGILTTVIGKNNKPQGNEFDFIKGSINNIINLNVHLKEEMKNQELLIKNIFFERLLHNRFANAEEMNNHMKHAGISFEKGEYQVILVRFNGYFGQVTREMLGEMDEVRILIMDIINKEIGEWSYLHIVDETTIAIVMGTGCALDINEHIRAILEKMEQYKIIISFAIGLPRDHLISVWESFNEAEWVVDQMEDNVQMVDVYNEEQALFVEYHYPIEVAAKLTNLVKIGDKHEVESILINLYEQNFTIRHLSWEKITMFIIELCGTLIKLGNVIYIKDPVRHGTIDSVIKTIVDNKPCESDFYTITEIFVELCDYTAKKKKSDINLMSDRIIDYMKESYQNPNLCLYHIASKFNLTEKYFSHFFKEQTGENFSTYLEKIRMDKAKELLSTNQYRIKEISKLTGYQNTSTFYKAFKRVYGASPRALHKCKEIK